ncbi:response regulator transcription factor [Pelagicoccus sp. SDUM812005]|uniref:response regulator transcription factor n=1 Tax=Pelagicoccus sp. SDUM812005 TaxID=3041257 RepID=UPI00280D2796|nr:response regulator transcription factor [Pelagicoccus sp. SDUM812005]MDQ8180396.1 response regulator transcription factor [Pelagicoccus sp. SDUM812005]
MRILVVEDDEQVAAYIAKGFKESGSVVDVAVDGREGLFLATTEDYDVVVLDRMLPQLDGLTVLRTLRGSGKQVPILILSTLDQVNEKVEGLKSGADDYLAKPFSFSELLARVEALARRGGVAAGGADATVLRIHDLEVDLLARRVKRAGREIEMQAKEFSLLEFLIRHADQVVSRTMLLEKVWHYHFDPQTNVIDVHISRLRSKVDKAFEGEPALLKTIRGMGYKLESPQA